MERKCFSVVVENLEKIAKNNSTLCLHPFRVFKKCHKCKRFCNCKNPQITEKTKQLLEEKRKTLKKLRAINRELQNQ